MIRLKRFLHLLAAFLSLCAAVAILIHAGLLERADFTGYMEEGAGLAAPEIGKQAPPFQLLTSSLEPLSLSSVNADVTIVNFWATWCQPCRTEMRALQQLYDHYPETLRVLAINLGESADTVRRWIDQHELRYDILLDPLSAAATSYHIRGLPSTFLLDSSQRIQKIYYGSVTFNELLHDINVVTRPA